MAFIIEVVVVKSQPFIWGLIQFDQAWQCPHLPRGNDGHVCRAKVAVVCGFEKG